jgi:hypothetical protein
MKLTEKKKKLLREFVDFKCENCHKHETITGTLWIHHINRKCHGGSDNFRNLKVICSACSKLIHYKEWK